MKTALAFVLLGAALLQPEAAGAQFAPVPPMRPHPCPAALADAQARCGTVEVPEDRTNPRTRIIALNVIILYATHPTDRMGNGGSTRPPLFDIDGGPGLPDTKNAEFYVGPGAAYRREHDIILVDQRGTGASNGLHCPDLAAP